MTGLPARQAYLIREDSVVLCITHTDHHHRLLVGLVYARIAESIDRQGAPEPQHLGKRFGTSLV